MRTHKLLTLAITSFGLTMQVSAQSNPYDLASIPDSLKKNANIITHVNDVVFTIDDIDQTRETVHKVVTVLNEDGRRELFFGVPTDKVTSLDEAEIKVLDNRGKQTAKYKKKDMSTEAIGEGLVEEGYLTYYRISVNTYPVTVEFYYELKRKTSLFIPDFQFAGTKEAVISSSYLVKVNPEIKLRYQSPHLATKPVEGEDGKYKTYKWTLNNLAPLDYEENAGGGKFPCVYVVSDQFSHFGLKGDLSSWHSFSIWVGNLFQGLDVLSADRQAFFQKLVKDAPNDREKIRLIYQYLQQNFRFVSIQLGIGGLKPFSAEFTDQKKYGDCKALSNFMKAALKSVGIRSHVAIINSGYDSEPVNPDFPSNRFNHVILCVPNNKDSIWLECTSSTSAFADLGTFTENRNALLLTETGGLLVRTPSSHADANTLNTVTKISLDADLSATSETIFQATGEYLEMLNDVIKDKVDDQKRFLVFYMGFRQPDLFELSKGGIDSGYTAKLLMLVNKAPEFSSGDKLFVGTRINKLWPGKLPKSENRKSDFYFRFPQMKSDTTVLKLPAGAKPEQLPAKKELSCEFVKYRFNSWYNEQENSIYTTTEFILQQHKIPAAKYAEVKKFFDTLSQEETQKIVIKTSPVEKKAF